MRLETLQPKVDIQYEEKRVNLQWVLAELQLMISANPCPECAGDHYVQTRSRLKVSLDEIEQATVELTPDVQRHVAAAPLQLWVRRHQLPH